MKFTNSEKIKELLAKENLTEEEKIYLALAKYENAELFTKSQLNQAVNKAIGIFANLVKNKIATEIVYTMISELKQKEENGKINFSDIEIIGTELIKVVEKNDQV